MKSEIYCTKLFNTLYLDFNQKRGELNINFTGIPKGNLLAVVDCPHKINLFKQYLNSREFQYLKTLKNCLDFNEIELILTNDFSLDILLKIPLQEKMHKERKIYLSCDKDLILWSILSVNRPFNLQEIRKQILLDNQLRKGNRFN